MWIIEQGKDIFGQLLLKLQPRLLLLHGKDTVVNCIGILIKLGLLKQTAIDINSSIEQMEKQLPLLCFEYRWNCWNYFSLQALHVLWKSRGWL